MQIHSGADRPSCREVMDLKVAKSQRIEVRFQFQNEVYVKRGYAYQVDVILISMVVDRVRCRVKQRQRAYHTHDFYHRYQKDFERIQSRLDYLSRLKSLDHFVTGMVKLMPLLSGIGPSRSSEHFESYNSFLNELNQWIIKYKVA